MSVSVVQKCSCDARHLQRLVGAYRAKPMDESLGADRSDELALDVARFVETGCITCFYFDVQR